MPITIYDFNCQENLSIKYGSKEDDQIHFTDNNVSLRRQITMHKLLGKSNSKFYNIQY